MSNPIYLYLNNDIDIFTVMYIQLVTRYSAKKYSVIKKTSHIVLPYKNTVKLNA